MLPNCYYYYLFPLDIISSIPHVNNITCPVHWRVENRTGEHTKIQRKKRERECG